MKCEIEHWCRQSILPISAGVPRVPIWRFENSFCRCLNFLLIYRRRNDCSFLKHKYHYGMTTADFINRFKNYININGKIHVVYADATFVEVLINSHIVNNTLNMKWFIFICGACAELTLALIEFVKSNSLSYSNLGVLLNGYAFLHETQK